MVICFIQVNSGSIPKVRFPLLLPRSGDNLAPHFGTGKAKSPSFREHDVTNLCVVLYLHAAHEYNLISAPVTGYGTETMRRRRKQFLARNVLVND